MIEEALYEYLKTTAGFERVMQGWIQQYKKLGRLGGRITVPKPNETEKAAIGGFMGIDYRKAQELNITYINWSRAIANSRFEGCDFLEVLKLYVGKKIQTNEEYRKQKTEDEKREFHSLCKTFENTKVEQWLQYLIEKRNKSYSKIKQLLQEGKKEELITILDAINHLPFWNGTKENIAIFATHRSGDPHFFDTGSKALLLYESILFFKDIEDIERTLEERNKIYYDAGLLKDDLSNNCMLCHINGIQSDGLTHPAWNGFYENYEPWIVSLYNLQQIQRLHVSLHKVFIVENPSIFRLLCSKAKEFALQHCGFICTNGQLNVCAFILLDMLEKEHIAMYYAGDFDPEGLLIADKLKKRYPQLHLWHYEQSDYKASISNKKADSRRLAMLEKCENTQIIKMIECMAPYTYCGYQEALIAYYIEDLKEEASSKRTRDIEK